MCRNRARYERAILPFATSRRLFSLRAHTRAAALRDLSEAERLEQDAERREGKRPPAINGGPAPESPPEK